MALVSVQFTDGSCACLTVDASTTLDAFLKQLSRLHAVPESSKIQLRHEQKSLDMDDGRCLLGDLLNLRKGMVELMADVEERCLNVVEALEDYAMLRSFAAKPAQRAETVARASSALALLKAGAELEPTDKCRLLRAFGPQLCSRGGGKHSMSERALDRGIEDFLMAYRC